MKNAALIVLALLLAWNAVSAPSSTGVGLAIVGPLTQTAFSCLAEVYNYAFIRAYKVSGTPGIDPNAMQTILNAQAAGF